MSVSARKTGIIKKRTEAQVNRDEIDTFFPARHFSTPPQDRPRAIVIDIEGAESTNTFSHAGILSILKIMYPGQNISDKVSAIEFENANVIANANNKNERWIIEAKDFISRNKIFNEIEQHFPNRDKTDVRVRMYSAVRDEEYRRFLRFAGMQDKLKDYMLCGRMGHH
ncbi:unnamed protein product [Oikopleura dioica]|uniref:Uncharacterized protein n=1 Tax=Oikopleura dioica TaxID=34765 RepID=E4XH58_OIKDI|nr:unnamed protein product [Oikopleura dioica]